MRTAGRSALTAAGATLMLISMVINESLVARTFATSTLPPFDVDETSVLILALAVGIIIAGFLVSIAGNEAIGTISTVAAVLRVGGILVVARAALWAAGFSFQPASGRSTDPGTGGMLAAVALAILAYKGLTLP